MRLNFSVGDYTDTVICDVLPMDACHLLLGRPWQYDRHATHEGRSNTYSFWKAGRRHVLRSMFMGEIMVDTTASLKKSMKSPAKPRTVLFQGGEDDVTSRVKRDQVMNSNSLTIGQITMKVPSSEPPAEEVTPNFRTPSWTLVGAIPIQVA